MKERIEKWIRRIRFAHARRKRELERFVERVRAIKKRLEFLAPLLKGQNLMYPILGIIIAYGFIAQFLGWV